ncbi:glucose-6-phosphate isomerase [Terrihabitans rhizophilus]|uniref:Glucose-6-phosphate isomerase n=1 Tax=Terrihabitans rhizophilus TaxID=3092662 RepID=A0ABU4RPX1_9HYPH|nr:glucose-6-phosphate isomerase [Terrihabitans sp. PJ23]MDX6806907.1 glucose-6-phosphate isomerase [Terrihabitans sp. PJ23]
MSVTQNVDRAFASSIGEGGVDDAAYKAQLERAGAALDWVRAAYRDNSLPILRMGETTDDLPAVREMGAKLRAGATDLVFLGTGGSSLGCQALVQLADYAVPGLGLFRSGPRLHFLDNLDPITLEVLLTKLPLETTHFLATSKSGGTGETLLQCIAVIAALKAAGLGDSIGQRMFGISEPEAGKRNALRGLLEPFGVQFLEHHTGVGGRFSVLTNVGLLPAFAAGLDIDAIRAGAAAAMKPILDGADPADVPPAVGAALQMAAADGGRNITVMMAYADRLERTNAWWVQLWSESLGKDGKGTTPLRALGPVDQHSQLQLHLGGPKDKLFTVVTVDVAGFGPKLDKELSELAGEPLFAGKTVGDLVAAQGRATADTLAKNGRPVRTIHFDELDEHSLGEFLMNFMIETIIAGQLLGVDAFDQPAVEEGKILAKKYLAES